MADKIFTLEHRSEGVTVVWMDDVNEPVNTLKAKMIDEFEALLLTFEQDSDCTILVFASAKPECFIAGANLDMIRCVQTSGAARTLAVTAQSLHDRIQNLEPTTVAAIHGTCLGGGLEFALAFDQRVASADTATRLGLPEIRLGLLPAGGGTQRLPALVGAESALDLMLTGRPLSAERAVRTGLVDAVVPRELLIEAAIKRAQSALSEKPGLQRRAKISQLRNWLLAGNRLGRKFLFGQAVARTFSKTRGNYPAADKIIEVVRTGLAEGRRRGLNAEAEAFGHLVVSPESRQLVKLFFASRALKKESGVDDPGVEPVAVKKIGVLGAGLMGAGIAYASIDRALIPVRIKDTDDDGLGDGLAYIDELLSARVRRRSITRLQREHTLARITPTTDYTGFKNCNVVIEAVYENLELKRQMVREVENLRGKNIIFASNTSAIPIRDIADASRHPERVIGMHYFSPVEKMPLVEVVAAENTAAWVISTCVALGRKQGKTVIVVKDGPGFYTTRILGPYMSEAAHLLSEGVAVDRVDEALLNFGFPIGPMTLLDKIGIDVGNNVARILHDAFGDRMTPVAGMQKLVDDRRLGKKNGKGVYVYSGGKKTEARTVDKAIYELLEVEPNNMMALAEIAERCVLRMVNEAAHCLGEGVVKNPRDGDIGAVFGLGFPPFLGGPFRYLDARGCAVVRTRLNALAEQNGERFVPAPVIKQDKKFYN